MARQMVGAHLIPLFLLVGGANPYLDEGRRLYEQVRYAQAEEQLRLAFQVPTSTTEERRAAGDLLARSLAAQGRNDEARRVYAELLSKDPSAPPPRDASPKIRALFVAAKEQVFPSDFVAIEPLPAPGSRISARLVDPWSKVARLELVTPGPDGSVLRQPLEPDAGRYAADLRPGTSYWVEALSADGQVVARLGSEDAPRVAAGTTLTLTPSPAGAQSQAPSGVAGLGERSDEAGPPRWPGWTLAGISGGALAVGLGLVVSSEADYGRAGIAPRAVQTQQLDAEYRQKAIAGRVLVGAAVAAGAGAILLLTR